MDALEVETRLAEGEQALQARRQVARESAGTLEAHEAEKGLVKRRLPMGLAARQRDFAQPGTGEIGPAMARADGVLRPREQTRRGRDSCSRFDTFAVPRTGSRRPGEPGSFPLDAQVNLPARGDASVLQESMTGFEVEPPFKDSAGFFAPRFARDVAASVLRAVAPEASAASEGFEAQRPVPPEEPEGALLGVSVDGQGVPRIKAAAVKLQAPLGPGEKRQQKKAALGGVCETVEAQPRSPGALAARLVDPEAARARQQRQGGQEDSPSAQPGRRLASLGRTTPAVMARLTADAARRDPPHRHPVVGLREGALGLWSLATTLFKAWRRVTCGLDLIQVVGYLWSAANALFREGSKAGNRWGQEPLADLLRGQVGDVIGGLRPRLTTRRLRQSGREALTKVSPFFHHHRRWMPYDQYWAMGLPVGTGVVESACGSVVQHRLEGAGQRWSLAGAEAMLALRSLQKSHDPALRDDWRFRAGHERARL